MKKSQIAVLGALVFIAVIMLVMMGLGRIAVGKSVDVNSNSRSDSRSSSGENISETMALDDFDSIVVEGAWKVRIYQSEDFGVEVNYPSSMEVQDLATLRGSQLVLGAQDWQKGSGEDLVAYIYMPNLSELRIDGAADASFQGFNENKMNVFLDGAAQISGFDSKVTDLNVRLQGIGQIDLEGVEAVHAQVKLEGAGEIKLDMNGGELIGSLEGLGHISYSGFVSDEDIRVEGLGKVERK